jgi:hypothetical protein
MEQNQEALSVDVPRGVRAESKEYIPIQCNLETINIGAVIRVLTITCEATQDNDRRIGAMMDLAMAPELLKEMQGKQDVRLQNGLLVALVVAVIVGSGSMVATVLTH